jgi:hypothetical protein
MSPSDPRIELTDLLRSLRDEGGGSYIGASLRDVSLGRMRLSFYIRSFMHTRLGDGGTLIVDAVDVVDYCFRPDHLLVEGMNYIEVLTRDDTLLTKGHFDSCDTDNWDSPLDPAAYQLLRHGPSYVIAKSFLARLEP